MSLKNIKRSLNFAKRSLKKVERSQKFAKRSLKRWEYKPWCWILFPWVINITYLVQVFLGFGLKNSFEESDKDQTYTPRHGTSAGGPVCIWNCFVMCSIKIGKTYKIPQNNSCKNYIFIFIRCSFSKTCKQETNNRRLRR